MRQLYIECNMGAAGDMLMSALCELLPDPDLFVSKMNNLGIPGVQFQKTTKSTCGIQGTQIKVLINGLEEHLHALPDHQKEGHHHEKGGHSHTGMAEISHVLDELSISQKVKTDAQAVYELIAQAESAAHGRPIEQIHFHEVGTMDAIADVVGVCLLMELLEVEQIQVSPIHVGCGQVRCAHGLLPVPAPATAHILRGVPIYGGGIEGELCTPTGAALLKYFANRFGSMPIMCVEKTGYGIGTKEFKAANCVRVFLGKTGVPGEGEANDSVIQLSCNLDDMTGEAISFACERLWDAGALDVWTSAIQMKKNRPGQMLNCLCQPKQANELAALILKHTTTWGVRKTTCERYCMKLSKVSAQTPFGAVSLKQGDGYGIQKKKPEYEDVAQIAREEQASFSEILQQTSL